ncbi:MAG: hypothetical protein ACREQW_20260 [Candidatus Binatia bacterium]
MGDWERTSGKEAFVNLDGAGGTCDTMVQEISAGEPQRHLLEQIRGKGFPSWDGQSKL